MRAEAGSPPANEMTEGSRETAKRVSRKDAGTRFMRAANLRVNTIRTVPVPACLNSFPGTTGYYHGRQTLLRKHCQRFFRGEHPAPFPDRSTGRRSCVITILFVDDEEAIRSLVKHFLEISGDLTVETAPSAEIALEMMKGTIYDAIVCDYEMPGGMDGIGFLTRLRNEGNQIPYLIFTGRGQEEVAIDAINHGADFYIQKGESPRAQFSDLVQKIGQAVQRRRTENALRESERNYRDLLESLPDLILTTDRNGTVISLNSPGLLQQVRTDLVLKPWTRLIAAGESRKAQDAFDMMMASGEPMTELRTSVDPGNPEREEVPVTVYGTVIRSETGTADGARIVFRNIAGIEWAVERIRVAEERFASLLALLPIAVVIIDPEGIVRHWNVGAAHLFGWTEEEAVGKPVPFVLRDNEDEFRKILTWCREDEKLRNISLSAKRCNGSIIQGVLHAAPLHSGNGGVAEILLVVTNPAE